MKQQIAIASISKHQLELIVLQRCSTIIVEKLDVSEILPQLNSEGLLTSKDCQTLLNQSITTTDKAQYFLDTLLRKATGSLEKFKECLHKTQHGTAHSEILKALSESYDQEVDKINSQVDASGHGSALYTSV